MQVVITTSISEGKYYWKSNTIGLSSSPWLSNHTDWAISVP